MALIQPEGVRAAIAARLVAGSMGFVRESAEPHGWIRNSSHSPVHMEVAIGAPRSVPNGTVGRGDRQRTSIGVYTDTEIRVLFPYRVVTPTDKIASQTSALAVGALVRNWLMVKGWTADFSLLWAAEERTPGTGAAVEFLWVENVFLTLHQMPLA